MSLPLAGVRIVEMGQLIAIPHAVKLLGDMGAQIIRIESCARLDNYRTSSMYGNSGEGRHWDRAANFYEQNRNKYSLTLELNDDDCIAALRELVSISDVFAENFTPRVMRNFKLEYEDLRQIRPDIIMVSSTGYGYTGPWADYGAIGYTTEATSGLSHISGYKDGPPVLPEIPYADYTAAEHTAFAIMAALAYRARTGKGQFIDISQSETLTSTIPEAIMDFTVNGRISERMGNQDTLMSPHGCYPCAGDDKWIAIAISTGEQWSALCDVLERPEWVADTRFADALSRWNHRDAIDALLSEGNGLTRTVRAHDRTADERRSRRRGARRQEPAVRPALEGSRLLRSRRAPRQHRNAAPALQQQTMEVFENTSRITGGCAHSRAAQPLRPIRIDGDKRTAGRGNGGARRDRQCSTESQATAHCRY